MQIDCFVQLAFESFDSKEIGEKITEDRRSSTTSEELDERKPSRDSPVFQTDGVYQGPRPRENERRKPIIVVTVTYRLSKATLAHQIRRGQEASAVVRLVP